MRFSYAIVALMSLANALPTESNVEQRAASLAQRNVEDRSIADAAYLAEVDARAEGLKLEERKKKKNKNNATARSVADAAYLAEVDARANGLKLEERKGKKNKTAKAAAAANARQRSMATVRLVDEVE